MAEHGEEHGAIWYPGRNADIIVRLRATRGSLAADAAREIDALRTERDQARAALAAMTAQRDRLVALLRVAHYWMAPDHDVDAEDDYERDRASVEAALAAQAGDSGGQDAE